MIILVDLDGILCKEDKTFDFSKHTLEEHTIWYANKEPLRRNIFLINDMYFNGHTIRIFTARDYFHFDITTQWLKQNEVKYHTLIMNKPCCDVFIDDKSVNNFTSLAERLKSE